MFQSYLNSTFLASHTTSPFNSTRADALLLYVSSQAGATLTPSHNFGNNWIAIAGPTNTNIGFDLRSQVWYAWNPVVGPGHTVILELSAPESLVKSIIAVQGSNVSSPIDALSLIGSDNGTQTVNVVSPNITTLGTNDLLTGFAKVSAGVVFESGTGFTQQPRCPRIFLMRGCCQQSRSSELVVDGYSRYAGTSLEYRDCHDASTSAVITGKSNGKGDI